MRRRNVKNADQRIKDASLNVITEGKEHKGSWSKLFGIINHCSNYSIFNASK